MSSRTRLKQNYLCDILYVNTKYVNLKRIFWQSFFLHLNLNEWMNEYFETSWHNRENGVTMSPKHYLFILYKTFAYKDKWIADLI